MNELIKIMAYDMGIRPYDSESVESYSYRVIYSALGLWCLKSAFSEKDDRKGISKNAQSFILHNLAAQYAELCPGSEKMIFGVRNNDIAVFIRNLYEQTGYLLTLENNCNVINHSKETIALASEDFLFLGLPTADININGLGIHTRYLMNEIGLKDYLVRDDLTPNDYLAINYDECDFEKRDIELDELEFFNPCFYGKSSQSWSKHMVTDITVARKSIIGPYYRVMKNDNGEILFADEINTGEVDSLTGAEYRRLYIALKKHYDNPMQILVCPIDGKYTHIKVLGQLPNREYYYLLLNAWPKNDFADRYNYIIRNELTVNATSVLEALGFSVRKGEFYG